eukprot:176351_1
MSPLVVLYLSGLISLNHVTANAPISMGHFINSGTPSGVNISFDCAIREYAYNFGINLQPRHGSFVSLFDALQLQACNMTRPQLTQRKINNYSTTYDIIDNCIFYVDPINGSDNNNGTTPSIAFSTIEKGISASRLARKSSNTKCILNLMSGTFYQKNTISLNSHDSYLTIQNYNSSKVTISGGVPINFDKNSDWKLVQFNPVEWQNFTGMDNVAGRNTFAQSNDFVIYMGKFSNYETCLSAIKAKNSQNN